MSTVVESEGSPDHQMREAAVELCNEASNAENWRGSHLDLHHFFHMRFVLLVFVIASMIPITADARPRHATKQTHKAIASHDGGKRERRETRGQSIGAPWAGELRNATRLKSGDGYHLRRPYRAYGTRTMVSHLRRAIKDTLRSHPKAHVLAIGDLSAEAGGWISDHSSHRSGRDVDLGLFFRKQPAGYPESFVDANDKNLDRAATWALLRNLAVTEDEDGGVQVIFLDFEVQGILYHWAKEAGVSEKRLNRMFQYPHGRGASAGLVRHEPNHRDHLHVRFQCPKADRNCR